MLFRSFSLFIVVFLSLSGGGEGKYGSSSSRAWTEKPRPFKELFLKQALLCTDRILVVYGLPHSHPDIEQADTGYDAADEVYAQELTDVGIIQDETIVAPGTRPGHNDKDHSELDPDHHLDDQENASYPAGSPVMRHIRNGSLQQIGPGFSGGDATVKV